MDKENEEDKDSSLRKDIEELKKTYCDFMSTSKSLLEKLDNQETSEHRDINNILSEYAQKVIQDSKGPLKPDQLLAFFMTDVVRKKCKEPSTAIRKYSDDVEGVRMQVMEVFDNIEKRMTYVKKQKDLDLKFIKTIEKLNKTIDEEIAKNRSSKRKQSNLKEYFPAKNTIDMPLDTSDCLSQDIEGSAKSKQSNCLRKGAKSNTKGTNFNGKRAKSNIKNKRNLGKENKEYAQLSFEVNKRLKLNSSQTTRGGTTEIQLKPGIDLKLQDEKFEEMFLETDSEKYDSPCAEMMSVDESDEYSQPLSLGYSQEINMSGTVNEKNAPECSKNEETAPERHFNLRRKPFR